LSVGGGIDFQEVELPTPALLIVDLRFSIARLSLDFQSKATSRNRRKYWSGIFFSVSASAAARRGLNTIRLQLAIYCFLHGRSLPENNATSGAKPVPKISVKKLYII
jgi:hypothetical protein